MPIVLFVTYASHEHCEYRSKMFVADDNEAVEKLAKQWLLHEVSHFLEEQSDEEEDNEDIEEKSLDNLISYIYSHSVVHVLTERYMH